MERFFNSELGVIYASLSQEQLIGYLYGKVIESLAKWRLSKKLEDLETAQKYIVRLIGEQGEIDIDKGSRTQSVQHASEFIAEKGSV